MTYFPREPETVTVLDEVSSSVFYVGKALAGSLTSAAVWKISRFTQTGTVLREQMADGDEEFDNIWDDRLTLNYS